MARRERTTGLPRARRRDVAASGRRVLGIRWGDWQTRIAVIGGAVALLLLILGIIAYRIYDDRVGKPNSTVVRVGDESYSLGYFADRLDQYLISNSNSGSTVQLLEEDLLNKIEQEGVLVTMAKASGLDVSRDAITKFIAQGMGVDPGGAGSSFDALYRSTLRTQRVSDGTYRRTKEAELANNLLLDQIKSAIPKNSEQLTLRTIVLSSQADADAIIARLNGGEDFGTLAQTESADLESRQNNGVMQPEPEGLLPDAVGAAVKGKQAGPDVIGPIQVGANWWVFRIDARTAADLSDQQISQLGQLELQKRADAKRDELRTAGKIERTIDQDDLKWAEDHLN